MIGFITEGVYLAVGILTDAVAELTGIGETEDE